MAITSAFASWPPYAWLSLILVIPVVTLLHDIWVWMRMPPGPTPLPFVGNKFQLPQKSPWIQFQDWSKKYGPIFTIWIGRKPTIVLSDPVIAQELLEKRSTKYSSRPRMVAMGEILWDGASILVQPYGKQWSTRRKLLHQAMTPKALKMYKPAQTAEASRLCQHLLDRPADWEKLLERYTSSIVFSVAYGHRIDSLNAEVIRDRFKFMTYAASLNVPGRYMVESWPFLKYIPDVLAPWKADIKAHGREEATANMALVDVVRSDLARARTRGDDIPDSLCKLLLELREKEHIPLSDRDFSYIPASLFGAGSDTTASTLCSAFLALVTHPDTLAAAHAELDSVIGPSRSPTFDDEPHLPYIRALAKEVLRWRPVAVLGGTPHASTEDDHYEGYYIPSGTTILGNSWAINLNEEYYPNPHHFDPTRFLDSAMAERAKNLTPLSGRAHPAKAGHSSFGWGRRICPGADLAANSLFIALAKILWAFDVAPRKGVVYDTFKYTEGFNIRPQKFECDITIRSEAHREVLLRDSKEAEGVLEKFTPFGE
ncbi:cytochrome P450 [Aaosphaeria arxii CBS 175.79]|uniref:Cytochrome P450 n=1 Tax=Aaosphaeria arxii CBS 175.79 TaxID=1450172 RepID=A0A6A5Y345_9PLEO|nr:cytochrome P450 [Aaosphaeria arxii CBS 175.79]KAF2019858.1 cytochrome P450 [Aaosphaeria arxii CBS 175.79]